MGYISPTGKIFEMQDYEKKSMFSVCAFADGKIFAITNIHGNLPIVINIDVNEIKLLMDLENYDLHFAPDIMLSDGDDIYALELAGNRLLHYHIAERKCEYFDIECHRKSWGNFAAFAKYRNELYIFPTHSDEAVRLSFKLGKIEIKRNVKLINPGYKELFMLDKNKECFSCGCALDNIMWLFQKQGNLAVAYDMKYNTWKNYELAISIKDCVHTAAYRGKIYILSSEGKVYVLNPLNVGVEEITDCSNGGTDINMFSRLAVTDKKIYLLPFLGQDIFSVDLNTKKVKKYELYPEGYGYYLPEGWTKFYGYCEDEDHYYYAMRSMNFMLVINKRSGKERWIKFKVPRNRDYNSSYLKYNKGIISEAVYGIAGLLDFLDCSVMDIGKKGFEETGMDIWNLVK